MANKQLNYDIKFNTDMTSLDQLKEALGNIGAMTRQFKIKVNGIEVTKNELNNIQVIADQVGNAIESCFNPKLNTFNFTQFQNILNSTGLTVKQIEQEFGKLGTVGKNAFSDLAEQIYTSNANLKQTNTFLNKIGDTLANAAKWSVAYGAINNITNGIRSAWTYAVSLDSALNDIRIVTGKSYQEMEKFAKSANKAAKALGTSTMDYTKGSLIYYQQGLGEKEVAARTAVSAKTANVTGQTMQEVSEELTAVWNGFKVTADETESYVDKLAAVAAASASDLEELSTAMSRVASAASTMGINVDQLTAQIATIESVTRQDAASIGTALKTIYSRMGDLAVGAEDEFGVALGDVSGKMKQMGIDILDQQGNMRDMGDVIEEVAAKWKTWTDAQQQAAAVALAGKRQYNNLFALFENWDMYEANKTVSENSLGELQKQQDIYMESTQAHLEQLGASIEKVKDAFFNNKGMNNLIDTLNFIMNTFGTFVDNIGGGVNLLLGTIGILGTKLSASIGKNLGGFLFNANPFRKNDNKIESSAELAIKSQFKDSSNEAVQEMTKIEKQRRQNSEYLTDEDNERYNTLIHQTNELIKQKQTLEQIRKETQAVLQRDSQAKNSFLSGIDLRKKDGSLLDINSSDFKLADMGQLDEDTKKTIKIEIDKLKQQKEDNLNKIKYFEGYEEKYTTGLDDNGQEYSGDNKRRKKEQEETKKRYSNFINGNTFNQQVNQISKRGLISDETRKKLDNAKTNFKNAKEDANGDVNNKKVREAANKLSKELKKAYSEEYQALEKVNKALYDNAAAEAEVNGGLKVTQEQVAELAAKAKWQSITDNFAKVTSAVTQVIAAFSMLSSLGDKLTDDTMTNGEKIGAAISTIIPLIVMMLPILGSIYTAIAKNIAASKAAAASKVTDSATEAAAVVAGEATKQGAIATTGTVAVASGTAGAAAWGWVLLITVALAAVAVALAFAIKGIKEASKSNLERANENLEEQKNILEDITTAASQAQTAYEQLNETITNYTESQKAIENLKAGTDEWREAISKANEQALNLINTYSELASEKYMSVTSDGQIVISQEGLNKVSQDKLNEVNALNAAKTASQIAVKEAENRQREESVKATISNGKNLEAERTWNKITAGIGGGLLGVGAALSATGVGGILGIPLMVLGALTTGASGALALDVDYEEQRRAIYDTAQKQFKEYGNDDYFTSKEFLNLTQGLGDTAEETAALREEITKNILQEKANNEAIKALTKVYTKQTLANTSQGYKDSNAKEAYTAVITREGEFYKDYYKDKKLSDVVKNSTIKDADFKKYLAAGLGVDESTLTYDTENDVFKYGTDGQTINLEGALSVASNARRVVLTEENINTINGGKGLNETFNNIIDNGEINGNSLLKLIENGGGMAMTDLSVNGYEQELEKLKNYYNSLSFEERAVLGLDDDAFSADYTKNALDKAKRNFKDYNSFIKDKNYNVGQIQDIGNALSSVFDITGSTGQNTVEKLLSTFTSEEEATAFANALKGVNLGDSDALRQFINNLEVAGLNIDLADEKYTELIELFKNSSNVLNEVATGFSKIKEELKAINDLTKELELGSIISDEDYKEIISRAPQVAKYFTAVAEGYQLTGASGSTIRGALNDRYSNIENIQTEYAELNELGGKLKNVGLNSAIIGDDALKEQIKTLNDSKYVNEKVLKLANVSQERYSEAVENLENNEATSEDREKLKAVIKAAETIRNNAANGLYSKNAANEIFYTKNGLGGYQTLDQATAAMQKNGVDKTTQEKITKSWLANYANEYGTSVSVIEALAGNNKDYDKALKSLQLLNDYQDVISNIQNQSKNLKGESLALALEDQNTVLGQVEDTYKNVIASKKETLGIQTQENSYLALYSEYLSKVDGLTDEQKAEWKEILEAAKEAEDVSSQIKENVVSALDAKLQVTLDENQVKADWADFKKNYMKTDKDGNIVFKSIIEMNQDADFEARLAAVQEKTDLFAKSFNKTSETIAKLEKEGTNEALQKAQELRQEQKSQIEEQIDNLNELYSIWTEGWDKVISNSEEYADKINSINNLYQKLIDLNNVLNKNLVNNTKLYDEQIENQYELINVYIRGLDDAQARLRDAELMNDQTQIDAARENIDSFSQSLADTGLNLIDLIKAKAKDGIEDIFKELTQASEEWDRTKTLDDRLLNIVDSNLNRSQLRRKFQEAIDNADSLAAQQKIQKVMEEQLSILEEKDRLSQYEVDRANAVYELTLKQIALEESQRNASKMKLIRDTNGNLTYSFVQDEDAAAKAQEELEQAQANLFNIDNDQTRSQVDKFYQYVNEYEQAILEAREAGDTEREVALEEYYMGENGLITRIKEDLGMVIENLDESATENGIIAPTLENYKQAMDIYRTDLSALLEDIQSNHNTFVSEMKKAANYIQIATDKIEESLNSLNNSLPSFKDLVTKNQELIEKLGPNGEIGKLFTALNDSLKGNSSGVSSAMTTFTSNLQSFVNAMNNYKAAIGTYTSQLMVRDKIDYSDYTGGGGSGLPDKKPRKEVSYTHFDTGGYTGDYGSEGKLAILHQKELVLNADDTANMLAAVSIVRTLDETLGGIGLVLAAQSAAPAIKPSLGKLNNQNDVVDQNVRIEANFPNVTDRYEIQEAINNLVNLASQKAFGNNKY